MVGVYKVNMQESITIMFTNYNQLKDNERKYPVYISSNKIKYSRINLIKFETIHNESYKTILKK